MNTELSLEALKAMHTKGQLIGSFENVNNEAYHAGPGDSSSNLKKMLRSPAHYLLAKNNREEPTASMKFGTAAHTLILEGQEIFNARYAVMPESGFDRRTKDGKAGYEKFQTDNVGKEIISFDDNARLFRMADKIASHPVARELLTGRIESAHYWRDPATGILCKVKPDVLRSDGMVIDLKTTDDASPEGFAKAVGNFGYHISAPMYLDGVGLAARQSGKLHSLSQTPDAFIFVAIEHTEPHGIGIYALESEDLEKGRLSYQRALARLAECHAAKEFPSYEARIQALSLPSWVA